MENHFRLFPALAAVVFSVFHPSLAAAQTRAQPAAGMLIPGAAAPARLGPLPSVETMAPVDAALGTSAAPLAAAVPAAPAAASVPSSAVPARPAAALPFSAAAAASDVPPPSAEREAAQAASRFDGAPQTEYGEVADGPFPFKYAVTRAPGSASRDVLYFMHGGTGSERNWAEGSEREYRLMKRLGKDAPTVVSVSYGPLWALSPRNGGALSGLLDHFTDTVMPMLERKVGAPIGERLLFGHSMGGLNALVLAIKRPELFARVAAASPALVDVDPHASPAELEAYAAKIGVPLADLSGLIRYAGTLFPDAAAWKDFNPLSQGARLGNDTPPLYLSCGDKDGFFHDSCAMAALAASRAVDAVWHPIPGGNHGSLDMASLWRFLLPSGPRNSREDVKAENALLTSLGLDLHGQDFLVRDPFEPPQTSYRATIVPARAAPAPLPATVRADDLRADLPLLELVLRRVYGGWEHARDRGWDWKGWFARWRAMLAARAGETLPVAEAFAPVAELQRFQPDNHTRPILADRLFGHASSTALLREAPSGPVTALVNDAGETIPVDPSDLATQPQRVLLGGSETEFGALPAGWALSYPGGYGRVVAAVSGGRRLAVTPDYDPQGETRMRAVLALAQTPTDRPSYRRVSPEVGYLRMPTMIGENAAGYEDLVRRLPALSDGTEKVLIVDARGNLGGQLWADPLARWFDGRDMRARGAGLIPRSLQKLSSLTSAIFWNFHAAQGDLKAPLSQRMRETLQSMIDELLRPFAPERVRFEERRGGALDFSRRRFDPAKAVKGPLVLFLMDNQVASSGESLTGLLSTYPNVLLAGVSSAGVGEFGNIGEIVLPRTRVRYRVATDHNFIFPDGRSFEGRGLMPDVLLDTERSNSPESVLALAQSLASLPR